MKHIIFTLTTLVAVLFIACSEEHQAVVGPTPPDPENPTPEPPLPLEDPQIGDYYYADGGWSSELESEREVIGIVFWVGDATAQDPTLRREHPDCTHGLVLALKQKSSPWQSLFWKSEARVSSWIQAQGLMYDLPLLTREMGSIGKICGYNNTRAIEAYNSAPENSQWIVEAIEQVGQFREEVVAPSSSSGWYCPSPKELSLICTGDYAGNIYDLSTQSIEMRNLLNERLKELSGVNSLPGAIHWSSAEFDDQGVDERVGWQVAISVLFSDGDVSISFKDYSSGYIRPVLAF